jgi:hypothetical protein
MQFHAVLATTRLRTKLNCVNLLYLIFEECLGRGESGERTNIDSIDAGVADYQRTMLCDGWFDDYVILSLLLSLLSVSSCISSVLAEWPKDEASEIFCP